MSVQHVEEMRELPQNQMRISQMSHQGTQTTSKAEKNVAPPANRSTPP
jgi:hypothetical protein